VIHPTLNEKRQPREPIARLARNESGVQFSLFKRKIRENTVYEISTHSVKSKYLHLL